MTISRIAIVYIAALNIFAFGCVPALIKYYSEDKPQAPCVCTCNPFAFASDAGFAQAFPTYDGPVFPTYGPQ